jgi:hypothetical protein
MLQERLNYRSVLSIEIDITKSLSPEEAIKEYATKKCTKNVTLTCVMQLIKKNYIFLDVVLFVVFVSFFKFEICWDLFFIFNTYSHLYLNFYL